MKEERDTMIAFHTKYTDGSLSKDPGVTVSRRYYACEWETARGVTRQHGDGTYTPARFLRVFTTQKARDDWKRCSPLRQVLLARELHPSERKLVASDEVRVG